MHGFSFFLTVDSFIHWINIYWGFFYAKICPEHMQFSSEQDRQVPYAPGLTLVRQTNSNEGNEYRNKMISDLASDIKNVK